MRTLRTTNGHFDQGAVKATGRLCFCALSCSQPAGDPAFQPSFLPTQSAGLPSCPRQVTMSFLSRPEPEEKTEVRNRKRKQRSCMLQPQQVPRSVHGERTRRLPRPHVPCSAVRSQPHLWCCEAVHLQTCDELTHTRDQNLVCPCTR